MQVYERKRIKLKIVLVIIGIILSFVLGYIVALNFPVDFKDYFNFKNSQPVETPIPTASVTSNDDSYDSLVKSADVDDSYFDDAVFIGNSRMKGFIMYSGLENTTSITEVGMTVETAVTDPIILDGKDKITVIQKLKTMSFNKVYIMLGTNELGWVYKDIFIDKYVSLVNEIKSINPAAIIYIQAILPVNEELVKEDKPYQNNANIKDFNIYIKAMCDKQHYNFLDTFSAVVDENGELSLDESSDGVHLTKEACDKLLSYLKNHTVKEENNDEKNINIT